MMISKFHKLVHDKIFWWIFASLICISFIGLYIPGQRGKIASEKEQTVGKLYGKSVLYPEFSKIRNDAFMTLSLNMGRRIELNDQTRGLLDRNAWSRLATLKKAKQLGIKASDQEMLQTVRSLPFFQDEQGQFNVQSYKYFMTNILPTFGYNAKQFEEVYRDETTLQKVAYLPAQAALVTPAELKEAFHRLNDTFVVNYAELDEKVIVKGVTVSDEDTKTFYNENASYFATPEKVRVKYAEIPVANYLAQATATEADAQAYYDQNLADYVTQAATTNAPAEYTAFDDVKATILETVKRVDARRQAMEAATEMVIALTPAHDGSKTLTFEDAAATLNAPVKFAPDFAEDETPSIIDAGKEFVRAAFALEATPQNYYSDAIVGVDYVYVIGLDRRLPSIVPEFEVVQNQAKTYATAQASRRAFFDKAEELSKAAGADFKSVMTAAGATVTTTPEFSLTSGLEDDPNARTLTSVAASLKKGEVSAPLSGQNRTILLAQLAERTAADEVDMDMMRESLVSAVENQRLQTIMSTWQESILAEAEFVDLATKGE